MTPDTPEHSLPPALASARRVWLAVTLAVSFALLAAPALWFVGRPWVEARVRRQILREAQAVGFAATIGGDRLRPWLTVELQDVVLENRGGVRILLHEARLRPYPSLLGLSGRAARVAHGRVLVELPAGVRLDVEPHSWTVEAPRSGLRVSSAAPGETLEVRLRRGEGGPRVEARARDARLGRLVRVLRSGCPLGDLGTVDGGLRLEPEAGKAFRVSLSARSRGAALASLDAGAEGGCGAGLGARTDVEAAVDAVVRPGAGAFEAERFRLVAGGAEADGRFAVAGGTAHPDVDLAVDVPRLDFARLLATAGLDLPAGHLGSVSLALRVRGPLLEPAALAIEQRLDFRPPAQPLPAIERLKGPFLHHATTPDGRDVAIAVSPDSPDFVPFDDVPPLFVRTLLLGEDAGFWGHHGIDLGELVVAFATDLVRGSFARGGSTITQQLAKNLFLSREKKVGRKLAEASLALLLDASLGKRRELEIYLNVIEWGPGVYGLRPAARHYFGCEPGALTPKQMAFLVSMIPGPLKYQRSIAGGVPTPFFEGLMATLLAKLHATGALDDEAYAAALSEPLGLVSGDASASPDTSAAASASASGAVTE
jgi:hypothetical protein